MVQTAGRCLDVDSAQVELVLQDPSTREQAQRHRVQSTARSLAMEAEEGLSETVGSVGGTRFLSTS
jgi:hypothetical protein